MNSYCWEDNSLIMGWIAKINGLIFDRISQHQYLQPILKPNYFKKQSFSSSFLLTHFPNCNGTLNRVVSCFKYIELAYRVLQASLDLYITLGMMMKNFAP